MTVEVVLLQLAAATAATPALGPLAVADCSKTNPDEIVVCGSHDHQSPYRLPKLTHEYDRKPVRAQGTIAGVPARVHADSVVRPDGLVDKRLMITFSLPF